MNHSRYASVKVSIRLFSVLACRRSGRAFEVTGYRPPRPAQRERSPIDGTVDFGGLFCVGMPRTDALAVRPDRLPRWNGCPQKPFPVDSDVVLFERTGRAPTVIDDFCHPSRELCHDCGSCGRKVLRFADVVGKVVKLHRERVDSAFAESA